MKSTKMSITKQKAMVKEFVETYELLIEYYKYKTGKYDEQSEVFLNWVKNNFLISKNNNNKADENEPK